MKVAFFSTKPYDLNFFHESHEGHEMEFIEAELNVQTVPLAKGCEAICAFVNDTLDRETLEAVSARGIKYIVLRCAGFNNVDVEAAEEIGLKIARVPEYSPYAVAEHATALILSLNRKIHRAHNRVREGNFALNGLLGFDLYGRTVGVIGSGRIGREFARIMQGFGCKVIAHDPYPSEELKSKGVPFLELKDLFAQADIISLHCPLTPQTYHLIDEAAIEQMKDGVMLINTSRGALIHTEDVIAGLKSKKIRYLGLDVYEEEDALFFSDLSGEVIQDDVFARLLTFPNVLITGHQAFFTENALSNIAKTTYHNLTAFESGEGEPFRVEAPKKK